MLCVCVCVCVCMCVCVCVCAVIGSYWLILFPNASELTALCLTSCTSLRLMLGDYLEGRTRYHRRIVQVDHRGRKLMNVFGFLGGTKEEKGTGCRLICCVMVCMIGVPI